MNSVDLILKVLPIILCCFNLILCILAFIKITLNKSRKIKIEYNKHLALSLIIFLITISGYYFIIQMNWLNNMHGNKIGEEDKLWSILESSYWIFCSLSLLKLILSIDKKQDVKYEILENLKKTTIPINQSHIIEDIVKDDKKFKMSLYFIAFIIFAFIFLVLALFGKQDAFNVLQPATNLIK